MNRTLYGSARVAKSVRIMLVWVASSTALAEDSKGASNPAVDSWISSLKVGASRFASATADTLESAKQGSKQLGDNAQQFWRQHGREITDGAIKIGVLVGAYLIDQKLQESGWYANPGASSEALPPAGGSGGFQPSGSSVQQVWPVDRPLNFGSGRSLGEGQASRVVPTEAFTRPVLPLVRPPAGGSSTTIPSGGSAITQPFGGGAITRLPGGGSIQTQPFGNGTITRFPDGSGAITQPFGSGSITHLPSGGSMQTQPFGNGSVTSLPGGGSAITRPFGEGTITTLPDGGSAVTRPFGSGSVTTFTK